jgi:glycosyltransferase involved in cell wall biosynthesis
MAGLAAIQYAAEAFDTRVGKLMGRQIAGETFLQAWIRYAGADPLTAWVDGDKDRKAFLSHARELGATVPVVSAQATDIRPLKAAGALWLADPSIGKRAWHRRWYDQSAWSIVGITHTIATHAAMERLVDLLRAPVQPWDALICTSSSAKQVVLAVARAEAEYLRSRMGAQSFTLPQLPVIPLGVACEQLCHDPAARKRWRNELGLADADIAVLQFGRLSVHGKAHPTPLYLALAEAGRRLGKPLHLILAGKFINPGQEVQYRALAGEMAAQVVTHFVDGGRADAGSIRSAADIGTLLSDNIQETFGLAPVELMAAGLPVVASDWNGLKDTIEEGVTGFRAETIMPPAGAGELLALRYGALDSLDVFLSGAAQSVAVDIGHAARAFELLAKDKALRRKMGDAGAQRAKTRHDWPVVIAAYRDLLSELSTIRNSATMQIAPRVGLAPAHPANMDPFIAFASYASRAISEDMLITAGGNMPARVTDAPGREIALLHGAVLPGSHDLETIIAALDSAPISAGQLCDLLPSVPRGRTMAGIGWLLKMGYAVRADGDGAPGDISRQS